MGALFPRTEAQKKQEGDPPKWAEIKKLLDEKDDLKMPWVQGTLWAAYNAVTRFEDWREVRDSTPSKHLDRIWFGSGADLKVMAGGTTDIPAIAGPNDRARRTADMDEPTSRNYGFWRCFCNSALNSRRLASEPLLRDCRSDSISCGVKGPGVQEGLGF